MSKHKKRRHTSRPQHKKEVTHVTALPTEGSTGGTDSEQSKVEQFMSILNKGLVIPSGSIDSWPDQEWDRFSDQMELLTLAEQDLVWDVIQSRQDEAHDAALHVVGSEDTAETADEDTDVDTGDAAVVKDVMSMTDDEWEAFMAGIDGDDEYYTAYFDDAKKKESTKDKTGKRIYLKNPAKHCSCSGPGSKADKWATHTMSCPCYQEEWDKVSTPASTYKAKTCTHRRQPFELDEGLTVYASAFRDVAKESDVLIDVGVYLDSSWTRKSAPLMTTPGLELPTALALMREQPALLVAWPDMSTPSMETADMIEVLDWVLSSIMAGQAIEVGCIGGHGRTGTMLASLLSVQGLNPVESISRVWETYCINAVESKSQAAFIVDVYETMYGEHWIDKPGVEAQWVKMLEDNFVKSYSYSDYWTNKAAENKTPATKDTTPPFSGGLWGKGYL